MELLASQNDSARLKARACARQLMGQPHNAQLHLARVQAVLMLEGSEPVQGALADMFTQLDASHSQSKRVAYQTCKDRLPQRIGLGFEAAINQGPLSLINTLATRWSLLSTPSADIPARSRRCSVDDSRKLAAQAVQAFEANDTQTQQAFLDHCLTCHDKMAFMLARRAVQKIALRLPAAWHAVSVKLEEL